MPENSFRSPTFEEACALTAGAGGVTVGRFAWVNAAVTTVLNTGSGVPDGLISRRNTAQITTYLAEGSNVIPAGQPVTVFNGGDFFMTNGNVSADTAKGQKAYANLTNGTVRFAAAGTALTGDLSGYIETKFSVTSVAAISELAKISSHVLG